MSIQRVNVDVDKDLWRQFALSAAILEASGDYGKVTRRRLLEAALRYAACNADELIKDYDADEKHIEQPEKEEEKKPKIKLNSAPVQRQ